MSNTLNSPKMSTPELILQRITEQLEQGTVPWRKPWTANQAAFGSGLNIVSHKPYNGINRLLTSLQGFQSRYWGSFAQWSDVGGHVRKGERGTPIVFWSVVDRKNSQSSNASSKPTNPRNPKDDKLFILKHSTIFNLDQIDGVDSLKKIESEASQRPVAAFAPIDAAQRLLDAYLARDGHLTMRHGASSASYLPMKDTILMPGGADFTESAEYYSTAFHELIHSTGHIDRLARDGVVHFDRFGSHQYSKEELIAELGSAFLCGHVGISPAVLANQAAYIASWLQVLKNNSPRLIIDAASAAQKAAALVCPELGVVPNPDDGSVDAGKEAA